MVRVNYVTNASPYSGVGHQATEISRRLKKITGISLTEWHVEGEVGKLLQNGNEVASVTSWPGMLGSKSVNWIRLGRALARQKLEIRNQKSDLFHFTNQTLSFLAKKFSPSVVTVHDIIELLEPQDTKAYWLNRYLYSGISSANHIIAVSDYTKQTLQEHLHIPAEKISVIHNGVGPEFHPIPAFATTVAWQSLRYQFKLPPDAQVVLYVGSDHSRKNVITAVRAFAGLRQESDGPLVFIKVGTPGLPTGRAALLAEIDELNIRDDVRFVDAVSTEHLNELYNLANVLVFPSRYEGFGLPVLQAMAAGTPVVAANTTSLPEVIGDAGLLHDPDDVEALTAALRQIVTQEGIATALHTKGLARVKHFSWDRAAEQVREVYTRITL